jgi:hypothetical protein
MAFMLGEKLVGRKVIFIFVASMRDARQRLAAFMHQTADPFFE